MDKDEKAKATAAARARLAASCHKDDPKRCPIRDHFGWDEYDGEIECPACKRREKLI